MREWNPIETAPIGQKIDVWVRDLDGEGFRFPEVKVIEHEPTILSICADADEGWYRYLLHENGQYATHWMPMPSPPESGNA